MKSHDEASHNDDHKSVFPDCNGCKELEAKRRETVRKIEMVIILAGKELVINEFKERQLQHHLRMLNLVCHSLGTEATAEELLREYIVARRQQEKAA